MLKYLCLALAIALISANIANCNGGANGNAVLSIDDENVLDAMDAASFLNADECAQLKICTMSCSCGKATYFNVGQKDTVFPYFADQLSVVGKVKASSLGSVRLNVLEEDDLELSPDDAETEEDDDVESLVHQKVIMPIKITTIKSQTAVKLKPQNTPVKGPVKGPILVQNGHHTESKDKYPLLSRGYKAVCIDPKSRRVNTTIDQLVNQAKSTLPILLTKYIHQLSYIQPFAKLQPSGIIAGTNIRMTTVKTPNQLIGNIIKKNMVLEVETEQLAPTVSIAQELIMSYQPHITIYPIPNVPPKEETLGAIIKAWAHGINRLCEEDELVASTPIEYLSTLWDNYVQTSAPAVVNSVALKTLTTQIIGEIVKIWVERCECQTLIAAADPNGNYNAQKTSGNDACVSLCKESAKPQPINLGAIQSQVKKMIKK